MKPFLAAAGLSHAADRVEAGCLPSLTPGVGCWPCAGSIKNHTQNETHDRLFKFQGERIMNDNAELLRN